MKLLNINSKQLNQKKYKYNYVTDNPTILRNDTLIVRDNNSCIIYSPFTNIITRVAKFPKEGTVLEDVLKQRGFFKSIPNTIHQDTIWTGFTSLTLLLTRKCNLSCIYCYASPSIDGSSMPDNLAIDALNWFVRQNQGPKIRITFHGGGEPTLEQGLIQKVVAQAEEIKGNHQVHYLIVTNGTAKRSFLDWMMNYKFAITFSIDGPPKIQNRNRPFADGSSSSKVVENNIRYLVAKNYPAGVRLTYSSKDDIVQIIRYFGELGIKKIHLEPLFPYGRYYNKVEFGNSSEYRVFSPETNDLIIKFLEAMDTCKNYGMKIYNGHIMHFNKGIGYFCGAASGRAMLVTHDGLLTGCLEVVDSENKDIKIFKIGNWVPNEKRFEVDIDKISVLQKRHADILSVCRNCFARYVCAGGCAVKAVRANRGFFGRDISYCGFTRAFVSILIKRIAAISKI
ncbi:MAG: radical SAM protein [Candidatus Paceibacterota bacterium]|jgi:uncharacterized protein